MMRSYRIRAAVIAALVIAPLAAQADTITYDFTGTIDGATGTFAQAGLIGSSITGSYTFDFGAASPTYTFGTVGSQTSDWYTGNRSGIEYGSPASGRYTFSTSAHVGPVSYATDPAYAQGNYLLSAVSGSLSSGLPLYHAQEGSAPSNGFAETSDLTLLALAGRPGPWTANGLPDFAAASVAAGSITLPNFSGENTLQFGITSMTPIPTPLPAAALLLLSGLGGLGALAGKRGMALERLTT